MEKYRVRVSKDYLTFSSAHFTNLVGSGCDRLHGHNYRVAVEIEGPLNTDAVVFDFTLLKRLLRDITAELDHRVIISVKSPLLKVRHDEKSVSISCRNKEWILPREDCVLLQLENTTAELLAHWLARRLRENIAGGSVGQMAISARQVIRIEVEESPGQSAFYELASTVDPGQSTVDLGVLHQREISPDSAG